MRDLDLKFEHFLNLMTIPTTNKIVVTIKNPMTTPTVIAATWPDNLIFPNIVLSIKKCKKHIQINNSYRRLIWILFFAQTRYWAHPAHMVFIGWPRILISCRTSVSALTGGQNQHRPTFLTESIDVAFQTVCMRVVTIFVCAVTIWTRKNHVHVFSEQ